MKFEELKKYVDQGYSLQDLSNQFDKSKSGIRYWLLKYDLKTIGRKCVKHEVINGFKICNNCGENKSINCYQFRKDVNNYRAECRECFNKKSYSKKYNKKLIVEYKGGKCQICGIISDIENIYDLHHKNPSKKEYQISSKRTYKINSIKNELDKCYLLCSNCHSEVHGGLHPNYIIKPEEVYQENCVETRKCTDCNKILTVNNFYKYKNNKVDKKCIKCWKIYSVKRNSEIKLKCLEYKGGKCIHCGYSKYIGAIDFHHIDPRKKDFRLSKNQKSFGDSHKKELDKCIALCSNCHRKEHYRLNKLTKEKRIEEYNKKIEHPKSKDVSTQTDQEILKKLRIKQEQLENRKCKECEKTISKESTGFCLKCSRKNSRKVKNRPSKEILLEEVKTLGGYSAVGRKYGVSCNAVKKWLK